MNNSQRSKSGDTLDPRILTVVLALAIFEFEIFTFTRGLVEIAGQDAVITTFLGGTLLILLTLLLVKLAHRFPQESFFAYSKKVWGKPMGLVIIASYLFYFYTFMVLLFQNFANANRLIYLQETPALIPLILMGLGAVWLVSYGFSSIVRFFQLFFPFFAITIIVVLLLGIREVQFENFFPILSRGIIPVLHGAIVYVGFIQGVEVLLFVTPFLNDKNKILKPALGGIFAVILFSVFASVNAIGVLGAENTLEFTYPGIALLSAVELPGFAVERFELLLTLTWLIAIFTTMAIYIYLLSFGIIELFGLSHRKLTIGLVTAAIIGATYLIPNVTWMLVLREYYNYFTLIFIAVIPALTFLMAVIRGKEGNEHA
ncbi:GerAB/ArcD/ProY family transporter [Dethiobacter alkaliphilus]|uniref:GerAB/ArcD/ProY family transporter n=1 Tax=Dethiobacter alkaliphilus TaxID=427926 RepID=UPI0022269528|nr:spore germination protein [Dethiobacter alkaliphilus]MCW3490121.1 spore germination protein [Dethiobacter alkaliphilus]